MPTDPAESGLQQRCIGVPESRQLDLFADMLEQRGARVRRCPLVNILDTPDHAGVHAWLDDVLARGLDDMIWLTGEGVRRLNAFAERAGRDASRRLLRCLAASRAVTRGPKPARELRALGLKSDLAAAQPTTNGVIETLQVHDLSGRRVGVQLYGTDPNPLLMDFLADKQAVTLPVAPYVYADHADEAEVVAFIDAITAGELDAIAFTSSPQIKRLFTVADRQQRGAGLRTALDALCVAAVGPLVARQLEAFRVQTTLMPDDRYFMKPLVRALTEHFGERVAR